MCSRVYTIFNAETLGTIDPLNIQSVTSPLQRKTQPFNSSSFANSVVPQATCANVSHADWIQLARPIDIWFDLSMGVCKQNASTISVMHLSASRWATPYLPLTCVEVTAYPSSSVHWITHAHKWSNNIRMWHSRQQPPATIREPNE